MTIKLKSTLLWVIAVIFTLGIVVYQKATGPTQPVKGKVQIAGKKLKYKLLRSHGGDDNAMIKIYAENIKIQGKLKYKRYPSDEPWTIFSMIRENEQLIGILPNQPPAGKLAYKVELYTGKETVVLTEEPVIIRFTGAVSILILAPHIVLMFLAMLFSTRTGLEALARGKQTFKYAMITAITLFLGGLILGPVVQWLAFGDLWTGWPFGQDLTDNKTLVAFFFWLIAVLRLWKNPEKRGWALAASIVLLAVYLVPHSMFGSELDYNTGEVMTG